MTSSAPTRFSSSFVATLAHQSGDRPLSIIASHDRRSAAPVIAQVPNLVETVSLAPLTRAQTIALAVSLFGDNVPNLERLGDWLHRIAAGSPKVTMQLAEHLLAQGIVRYADGTWVLPSQVEQALPPSAAAALLSQLHGLSAGARALAELLCVSRAGASVDRILDLSGEPPASVLQELEELVQSGVLDSARNAYAFAQEALRETLLESLEVDRRHTLHTTWADCLLSGKPNTDDQLEAGWHLIHTRAELRGADILATVAPDCVERRVNMAVAVPALEKVLEVYKRHDRPLAQQLRLRSLLVLSSYLFDHPLAQRHAEATLDALYPFVGLDLAERWSRFVGNSAAFGLAMGWTLIRWIFKPRKTRGPHAFDALKYYAQAAMGLVGLRALAVDPQGTRAAFGRLRAFEGSPHPSVQLVFALAKSVTLHMEGRGADAQALVQRVLTRLEPHRKRPLQISEAERVDLVSGAMLLEGLNECYRARSRALEYVERLTALRTPITDAAAMRIRMTYYMVRGETERTQFFRKKLDLLAIQNGTVWQTDWVAASIEGLTGAIWSDLVLLRRALDALASMAKLDPGFASQRDFAQIAFHFRRSDFTSVVRDGEEYMKSHPPFSMINWPSAYAFITLSHLELGNIERARAVSEHAYAALGDQHREYAVQHSPLEAAYAAALAVGGEQQRAAHIFDSLLERLRDSGEQTHVCLVHACRVKVGRWLGDAAATRAALSDLRDAALMSGNPSVILLADSVAEQDTRARTLAPPQIPPAEPTARDHETLVTAFLLGEQLFERRAQNALGILAQFAQDGEAYIFWHKQHSIALAASLDKREPPLGLEHALTKLAANNQLQQTVVLTGDSAHIYTVVPFVDAGHVVGFATLGGEVRERSFPKTLLSDIERALLSCSEASDGDVLSEPQRRA